jgi:integrase
MTTLARQFRPGVALPPLTAEAPAVNATIHIRLPRISWRDGRPRFEPSPTLRRLGLKGEDLRHGPDGPWFSPGECVDWIATVLEPRLAEAKAIRAARPAARPATIARQLRPVYSLGQMFADLWKRPEFTGQAVADGRRRRKPLAPRTVRWYRAMAELVARFDPELWAEDATAMTAAQWAAFLERVEQRHGLDTARAVRATLSMAFGRMRIRTRKGEDPMRDARLPMPPPRLRVGEIAEMQHLIATADRLGRPEIGDSIMLGLMTCQRQADRLALEGGQIVDGEIMFRQRKTGARVLVPAAPPLLARIEAARARRQGHRVSWPQVVIDEQAGRPWAAGGDHYRHVFAAVRDAAAETMPGLKGFRDQDLRDTGITWLANAGCDAIHIAAISGHSLETIHQVLRHYLVRHPDQARAAIGKLVAHIDAKGGWK